MRPSRGHVIDEIWCCGYSETCRMNSTLVRIVPNLYGVQIELAFRWCKSRHVTWAFLLSLFENIVRYNNRLTNCSCTWYSAVDSTYYTVTGHCSCWCRLQSWAMSPCRSFTFNQSFREMPNGTVSCKECHKLLSVHRAV